jgi:subfamily B ATP-binding cassette protein MsbA
MTARPAIEFELSIERRSSELGGNWLRRHGESKGRMVRAVIRWILGVNAEPLLDVAARFAWAVPVVAALSLLSSALESLSITLLVPLLGSLSGHSTTPRFLSPLSFIFEWSASKGALPRILVPAGLIVLLIIVKSCVQSSNAVLTAWVDSTFGGELRKALARRLLSLGYAFTLRQDPSRLVNIVANDVWRATEVVRLLFSIVSAWAAVAIFSVVLLSISVKLFVFVGVGVALIRGIQVMFASRMRRLGQSVSQANELLAERMLLVVLSMRLINMFGQEESEHRRFAQASDAVNKAMYSVQKTSAQVAPIMEVLQAALFVIVLLTAYFINMAMPTIAAFLILLYRMQPQLVVIGQSRLTLASLKASVTEVEWLLGPEGKPAPQRGALKPDVAAQPIVFDNVSYVYPGKDRKDAALRHLSFQLEPRRVTALIGPSGAGKSTIVNLLCRLTEPDEGAVRCGDLDLREIDPAHWRSQISLAGQDIDLVDGTIADNIRYGVPTATFEQIREAAQMADADAFINALPGGYEARAGLRGLNLSGGQRQRIGLARALLRKPAILILDEATNAVDGMSESTIMRVLHDRSLFQTVLVISHRRSTLGACENGIVIIDGRIQESGRLEELAFYRTMGGAAFDDAPALTREVR